MDIKRNGSRPSAKGPAEYFTGTVRIDPLFEAADPARVVGVSVTFEPGARTAWHTHPLGQTLIVTAGCGRAQRLEHDHTLAVRDGGDSTAKNTGGLCKHHHVLKSKGWVLTEQPDGTRRLDSPAATRNRRRPSAAA